MLIGPFDVHHHAVLDSTNEEAKRLAARGCAHGTVIWADQQTSGHGRFGRPWHSPPGNLLFSVVLRHPVAPSRAAELGFLCAVVTAECVAALRPADGRVGLKWPNDVQVDGAKIAGILPECQSDDGFLNWVVLGVGLNLAHAPSGMSYPVTSLSAHAAIVTPERCLREFLGHFGRWIELWEQRGFDPVRSAWLGYARGLGTPVTVNLKERREHGIFHGIDASGAMLLVTSEGQRRITAGDVAFGTS
jgi:BirA family biotin operon repressor/biotin-[acetyl-CoA-carboxylase] ligase